MYDTHGLPPALTRYADPYRSRSSLSRHGSATKQMPRIRSEHDLLSASWWNEPLDRTSTISQRNPLKLTTRYEKLFDTMSKKRKREATTSYPSQRPPKSVSRTISKSQGTQSASNGIVHVISDEEDARSSFKISSHLTKQASKSGHDSSRAKNPWEGGEINIPSFSRKPTSLKKAPQIHTTADLGAIDDTAHLPKRSRSPSSRTKIRSDQLGPTYRANRTPFATVKSKSHLKPVQPKLKPKPKSPFPQQLANVHRNATIRDLTASYSNHVSEQPRTKPRSGPFLLEESDDEGEGTDHDDQGVEAASRNLPAKHGSRNEDGQAHRRARREAMNGHTFSPWPSFARAAGERPALIEKRNQLPSHAASTQKSPTVENVAAYDELAMDFAVDASEFSTPSFHFTTPERQTQQVNSHSVNKDHTTHSAGGIEKPNGSQQSVLSDLVAKAQAANREQTKFDAAVRGSVNGHQAGEEPNLASSELPEKQPFVTSEKTTLPSVGSTTDPLTRAVDDRQRRIDQKKARNERYRASEAEADANAAEDDQDHNALRRAHSPVPLATAPEIYSAARPVSLNSMYGGKGSMKLRIGQQSPVAQAQQQIGDAFNLAKQNSSKISQSADQPDNPEQGTIKGLIKAANKLSPDITADDLRLLQWRTSGLQWSAVIDMHKRQTGVHRSEDTLRKRFRYVQSVLQADEVSNELCEEILAGKEGAAERLNRTVSGPIQEEAWSSSLKPSHQTRNYKRDRPLKEARPAEEAQPALATQANPPRQDDATAEVVRDTQVDRPVYGGKQPTWELLQNHWNFDTASDAEDTEEEDAEVAVTRASSADPLGYIHFAYQVQRRECTSHQEEEEGFTVEEVPWHDVDDPYQCLTDANAAACGPVLLLRIGHVPIVSALGSYSIEKDEGEEGEAYCTYTSRHGSVQTRVVRSLRTFRDQIPAQSKAYWAPKTLYHIKLRVRKDLGEEDMFGEKSTSIEERCLDEGTSADLTWANAKAIERFVQMTYEIKSANLKLHDLEMTQLRQELNAQLEQEDDGALFRAAKQTKVGLFKVWVEKVKLVGPRNF